MNGKKNEFLEEEIGLGGEENSNKVSLKFNMKDHFINVCTV